MHAPVAQPACRGILRFSIRGGLNNQKECLVNAGIVAHALNLSLALPHFSLIGHGNERFEPTDAKYVGPYADRDKWGHAGHLFNTTWLTNKLRPSLDIIVRIRPAIGDAQPYIVELPSVANVTRGCKSFKKWQDTCEAHAKETRLLNVVIDEWRRTVSTACHTSRAGDHRTIGGENGRRLRAKLRMSTRMNAMASRLTQPGGPIIFDAGKSLCWNAYKSRFATSCAQSYPICGRMLRGLRWNRLITRLQERVLRGIARRRANASGLALESVAQDRRAKWADAGWAAVHVRAFVCAYNKREPKFDTALNALNQQGVRSGLLYVVSSVPVEQVQRAMPQYEVIAKSTFLGHDVRQKYPFEVLAAVDYGVAVAAPLYLGEPMMSSFDAFAQEERRRRGRSPLRQIDGACGGGAGPGA